MLTAPAFRIEDARRLVASSLAATVVGEFDLFALGAGERALVHQMALRMRRRAPATFDVDVEYDREGLLGHPKLLPPPRHGIPDVLIHQRGFGGPASNLLVVEVKRRWHGSGGDSADVAKVLAAMTRFGFRYGCTLELGPTLDRLCPRWSWWSWPDRVDTLEFR